MLLSLTLPILIALGFKKVCYIKKEQGYAPNILAEKHGVRHSGGYLTRPRHTRTVIAPEQENPSLTSIPEDTL